MKKYNSTITGMGPDALYFLSEGMNFIVIFNENAPSDLAELCVLHTIEELKEDPVPGDILKICGKEFKITAVGSEAVHTLRGLGHCTINFGGGDEAERPGCIMVEGNTPLLPEDFKAGETIEIYSI